LNLPTEGDLSDKERLIIRIPTLVSLVDGASYDLVGSNTIPVGIRHPDNHYGIQQVNDALQRIADSYIALHPGDVLRYNDMSLVTGGIFDLNGNLRSPHSAHGCGTDIDVGISAVNGHSIVAEDLARLVSVNSPGAFMIHESRTVPNHVQNPNEHFTFTLLAVEKFPIMPII
jgi:hypothetical protein